MDSPDKPPATTQTAVAPDASPVAPTPGGVDAAVSVFAGAGIGLMIGALLALSVSPTVGLFIGALGTGLAALMGLNDAGFSRAKGLRIGALGFGVLIGLAGGLYVRTHELLSPTLKEQRDQYLALGYSQAQALEFLEERIRMPVETATSTSKGAAAAASGATGGDAKPARAAARGGNASVHTVLFSDNVNLTDCSLLPTRGQDEQLTAAQMLSNFRQFKGWKDFANAVEAGVPEVERKPLLRLAKDAACIADTQPGTAPPRPSAEQCRDASTTATTASTAAQQAAEFARSDALTPVRQQIERQMAADARGSALRLVTAFLCSIAP